MPVVTLFRRETPHPEPINPIYIGGFCVVGVIILGLGVWGLIRWRRKRASSKREEQRGAAFLSVRGIVKDGIKEKSSETLPGPFARGLHDSSVVLPDKVLARPPKTRDDVLQFHRQSGTFPQPFTPKPFSFALSGGNSGGLKPDAAIRASFLSGGSSQNRFSVMSTNSSVDFNPTTGTTRKVRQLFDPVLPDELLVARVGEQLTVVQSFDDGWCLVGRESGVLVSNAKSLFKQNVAPDSEVELGVVPAWCFVKPVPGLRVERPIRNTSLGITVQMSGPSFSSRDEVNSWSNF
ncbi:hypothetical protein BDZ94DRAFT_1184579 [Collybia nuda]|uniref:SH3 domain-containing protein n=1 Tax=Collybia nuda TaxID=64659 RepID=A0A9P6CQ06_9AGAR|nr:hypothetical protein BDZ94DRAFT_1184579 [Collybia nuda]